MRPGSGQFAATGQRASSYILSRLRYTSSIYTCISSLACCRYIYIVSVPFINTIIRKMCAYTLNARISISFLSCSSKVGSRCETYQPVLCVCLCDDIGAGIVVSVRFFSFWSFRGWNNEFWFKKMNFVFCENQIFIGVFMKVILWWI